MFPLPSPNHYDPATVTHYRTPRGDATAMPRYTYVLTAPGAQEPYSIIDTHATTTEARHVDGAETEEEAQEVTDEWNSTPHYHVVAFIPGCLNDYDSGPFDNYLTAQAALESLVQDYEDDSDATAHQTDPGRYEIVYDTIHGTGYVLKVEECTEDCDPEEDY